MHPGRPINEVITDVLDRASMKRDYMVPASVMTLDPNFNLSFGSETLAVNDNFHDQLGSYLGIPAKFYDRLRRDRPDMISYNVNELLREKGDERRLVRALGSIGRAILSDRYRRLDNEHLAAHVLPILHDANLEVASAEITESRLYLQLVAPKIEGEIRVGEVVQAGVALGNSEIGLGSLWVKPFWKVYSCTNGMIITDWGKRTNHLGAKSDYIDADFYEVMTDETRQISDQALFMQTRDFIGSITSQEGFNRILTSMKEKAGERVTKDPEKLIENLSDKFTLRQDEAKKVLYAFLQGNDFTRWGVAQALTAQANDASIGYDRAVDFEKAGGTVMGMDSRAFAAIA